MLDRLLILLVLFAATLALGVLVALQPERPPIVQWQGWR